MTLPPPPMHLKGTTAASPHSTTSPTISTKSTYPTILSHFPLPPPLQPPPAPNIPPSFGVPDTNFSSITAFQLKGKGAWFKFVIVGSSHSHGNTKESIKQLTKKPMETPTYNPMKECPAIHDNEHHDHDHDCDHEDKLLWDVNEDEASLWDIKYDEDDAPRDVNKDKALWDVNNVDAVLLVDNHSDDEGDKSMWDHDDYDDSDDDVQIPLPSPAPNILTNSNRWHDSCFL
jgi:hypothetical protein